MSLQNGTLVGTIYIAEATEPVLETATVKSTNVEQTIVPQEGVAGFSSVTVEALELQTKTVTLSNQQQVIEPDSGKDGLSSVTVPAVSLQNKSVTPTSSQQVVSADAGYDGLSQVTVGAVQAGYDFVMKGPNNSVTLPDYMFYQDTNIKTFTGRSGDMAMTSISEHCFDGCSNLEAVYLPACGRFIGYDYFDNCPKLKDVYMAKADAGSIPTIDNPDEFYDIQRIHVPANQLADFQASSSFSTLLNKLVGDYV